MKNYILVFFAFFLLTGCDQEKKNQNLLLQKTEKELDSVLKTMIIFGPDLNSRDVNIEIMIIKEVPEGTTDLNDYIQLFNEGESYGSLIGKPNEFTSNVFADRRVKWKGKKFGTLDKPKIKKIIYKKGYHLTDTTNISQNPNEVERRIKSGNSLKEGDTESYSIVIEIGNGNQKITDTIDPIIRYHPD